MHTVQHETIVVNRWFKQDERSGATIIATYVVMFAASIALGFLISRYFSEPLNRRLRGNSKVTVRDGQPITYGGPG